MEADIEELRERLLKHSSGEGGGRMRESEDRFMREERLREGLER